jgi:hypothetical protein
MQTLNLSGPQTTLILSPYSSPNTHTLLQFQLCLSRTIFQFVLLHLLTHSVHYITFDCGLYTYSIFVAISMSDRDEVTVVDHHMVADSPCCSIPPCRQPTTLGSTITTNVQELLWVRSNNMRDLKILRSLAVVSVHLCNESGLRSSILGSHTRWALYFFFPTLEPIIHRCDSKYCRSLRTYGCRRSFADGR